MGEENSKEKTTDASDAEDTSDVRSELAGLEDALTDFSKSFERSARRWELMVYPAMIVFFVLGISGFYLIYSLTKDMQTLASHIDPQMEHNLHNMSISVQSLSGNIRDMTDTMTEISEDVEKINLTMVNIDSTMRDVSQKMNALEPMLANLSDMNMAMRTMTTSTGMMSRDMSNLNYNVGRPMSMFNMFPW